MTIGVILCIDFFVKNAYYRANGGKRTLIHYPELLVLLRHAESLRDKVKGKNTFYRAGDQEALRIKNITDPQMPITDPKGVEQARLTGIGIAKDFGVFDVVYDSDYTRAVQTREIGFEAGYTPEQRAQMEIRHDLRLRERDAGYAFFMTDEEAAQHFPWFLEMKKNQGYYFFRPPGGENHEDVRNRLFSFINYDLREICAGKRVLSVLHAGTIGIIRFMSEGWAVDQWEETVRTDPPKNCSVTVYRYSQKTKRLELECYNKVYWKEENGIIVPA